jgi:hypothetical protein
MSNSIILWYCILTAVIGLLALAAIVLFGILITRQVPDRREFFPHLLEVILHLQPQQHIVEQLPRYLADSYVEYLQRRNEFWTTYGQVVIAVLAIVVLGILLLTKTISSEAGLPILSGLSGFAIAKGVSSSRAPSSPPEPPTNK